MELWSQLELNEVLQSMKKPFDSPARYINLYPHLLTRPAQAAIERQLMENLCLHTRYSGGNDQLDDFFERSIAFYKTMRLKGLFFSLDQKLTDEQHVRIKDTIQEFEPLQNLDISGLRVDLADKTLDSHVDSITDLTISHHQLASLDNLSKFLALTRLKIVGDGTETGEYTLPDLPSLRVLELVDFNATLHYSDHEKLRYREIRTEKKIVVVEEKSHVSEIVPNVENAKPIASVIPKNETHSKLPTIPVRRSNVKLAPTTLPTSQWSKKKKILFGISGVALAIIGILVVYRGMNRTFGANINGNSLFNARVSGIWNSVIAFPSYGMSALRVALRSLFNR